MNPKKYLWTLYLIITTIVISIVTQVYFNYKNYQKNKQQFVNEVQISLDNAVDNYFAELAKKEFFLSEEITSFGEIISIQIDDFSTKNDTIPFQKITDTIISSFKINEPNDLFVYTNSNNNGFKFKKSQHKLDSLDVLKNISSIFLSVTNNPIHIKKLAKLLEKEFDRKNIHTPFTLNHFLDNHLITTSDSIQKFNNAIKTSAKSTYLKELETIELEFPNQTKTHLKKGLLGIFLSLLFALAIIASLFYLLNIIKKQKVIAEIKNDFISNITHEFKTPITTIGLAVAAIRDFNKYGKKEKTTEYLDITEKQLQRLNTMVEKVLETSVLDSEELLLHIEKVNLNDLFKRIMNKYLVTNPNKEIVFLANQTNTNHNVDLFHFENAITNLIDNAIKYGGNSIKIFLQENKNQLEIRITDSGRISKSHKTKIFDKFYRIPQGNKHDVKGFGIGLYYTRKIIEKHQGTIVLLDTQNTTFKIILPK